MPEKFPNNSNYETLRSKEAAGEKAVAFKTAKGSVYTYDEEGKTTRFKTATGEQNEQQDITVFSDLSPEDEDAYLRAYQMPEDTPERQAKIYVVERQPDDTGQIIRDISDVTSPDNIYLSIIKKGQIVKSNKAQLQPFVGGNVFDTRQYEENGHPMTERHIGNKVMEIMYDDETISDNPEQQEKQAFQHPETIEYRGGETAIRLKEPGDTFAWGEHKYADPEQGSPNRVIVKTKSGNVYVVGDGLVINTNDAKAITLDELSEPLPDVTIGERWAVPGFSQTTEVDRVSMKWKDMAYGHGDVKVDEPSPFRLAEKYVKTVNEALYQQGKR